jgi:hypothetical protein
MATAIFDEDARREIFAKIIEKLGGGRDLEAWVRGSPLVKLELDLESMDT